MRRFSQIPQSKEVMSLYTTRSYQGRLQPTEEQKQLLLSTMAVYQKGAVASLDILLNLSSVVRPGDNIEDDISTIKKAKETDFLWTIAHCCFVNWYVLESDSSSCSQDQIDPKLIKESFRRRWEQHGGGKIPATLLTHIESLSSESKRKDSVWVDRYATGEKFLKQFGIPREEAIRYVIHVGWPFILSTNSTNDAAIVAKEICSSLWGVGSKSAWDEITQFYTDVNSILDENEFIEKTNRDLAILLPKAPSRPGPPDSILGIARLPKTLRETPGLGYGQIADICKNELGIKQEKEINNVINFYDMLEQNIDEKKMNDFRKLLLRKVSGSNSKANLNLSPEWRTSLLKWLEEQCGISFQQNIYSEFFKITISAFGSWKSITRNQCAARHEAKIYYDEIKTTKQNQKVAQTVIEYKNRIKDKEQNFLRKYQYKMLEDIIKYYRKHGGNIAQSIKETQKIIGKDCGDINLINFLAASLDLADFLNSEKTLNTIVAIDEALEDVTTLYHPTLRHFKGSRTAIPSYGDSKKSHPYGEVFSKSIKNIFAIDLDLINCEGKIVKTTISTASKRFVKDILVRNGSVPAPRNHYHYELAAGNKVSPNTDLKKIVIQPYSEDDNLFYARFSVPLEKSVLTTKQIVGLPNLRILGVDRGQKNAAAFTVIERTTNPNSIPIENLNPKTKKDYPSIRIKVDHFGFVEDPQEINNQGEVFDRLSKCDRELTETEQEFFKKITNFDWAPKNYSQFQLSLAKHCRSLIRLNGLSALPDIKIIRDFILSNKVGNLRGGLSFTRIDALEMFQRVYKSIIRLYEDLNEKVPDLLQTVPPPWVIESFDFLSERRTTRRRERARITASRIVAIAIKEKCQVIAIEDLDFKTKNHQTRSKNSRIHNWMHRSVTKMLEQACELHGIYLRKIPSYKTSILDCTSKEHEDCRFTTTLTDVDFLEKIIRRSFELNRIGVINQKQREWLIAKAEIYGIIPDSHHANELATKLIAIGRPIPSQLGELYPVQNPELLPKEAIINGIYIDSDINAATNIGINAISRILNMLPPSKKES